MSRVKLGAFATLICVVFALAAIETLHAESTERIPMSKEPNEIASFSGGFIDDSDARAVAKWAGDFCEGQDVGEMAKRYGVDPTADAVAEHVASQFPSKTRAIAFNACKRALQGST